MMESFTINMVSVTGAAIATGLGAARVMNNHPKKPMINTIKISKKVFIGCFDFLKMIGASAHLFTITRLTHAAPIIWKA